MAPPRSYRAEALVLKHQPLGEADLLVTCYTREEGKVRAVARGARRPASKLVGHLEPLTRVSLSLARGRSLDQVTQAQVVDSFAALKGDLSAVAKGLYVAELVGGFGVEASANPALYRLALETLASLLPEDGQPPSDLPLRFFELHLLEVSGLLPELYQCVECRHPISPGDHRFSPNAGGTVCTQCAPPGAYLRPLSVRALKVLRLLHRSPRSQLPALPLDAALAQELRGSLTAAVEYWLDQRIRSSGFMEHLRRSSIEPGEPGPAEPGLALTPTANVRAE